MTLFRIIKGNRQGKVVLLFQLSKERGPQVFISHGTTSFTQVLNQVTFLSFTLINESYPLKITFVVHALKRDPPLHSWKLFLLMAVKTFGFHRHQQQRGLLMSNWVSQTQYLKIMMGTEKQHYVFGTFSWKLKTVLMEVSKLEGMKVIKMSYSKLYISSSCWDGSPLLALPPEPVYQATCTNKYCCYIVTPHVN